MGGGECVTPPAPPLFNSQLLSLPSYPIYTDGRRNRWFSFFHLDAVNRKRPIQGVFRKILTPHPLTARRVWTPPPPPTDLVQGEDTLAGWRGGGGSLVRKTPDTALYSIYVSTLCREYTVQRNRNCLKDSRKIEKKGWYHELKFVKLKLLWWRPRAPLTKNNKIMLYPQIF